MTEGEDIGKQLLIEQIEQNIVRKDKNTYELRETIDGLEYSIEMNKRNDLLERVVDLGSSGNWRLGFDVDGTHGLTNKGLKVYQQIVDKIVILIKKVQSLEKVKTITFSASKTKFYIEEINKLQKILNDKFSEAPEAFEGFHSEIKDGKGDFWGILEIKDGLVVQKSYNKGVLGNPSKEITTPLIFFITDKNELMSIIENEDVGQRLVDYLKINHKVNKKDNKRNVSSIRANLYERTLRQRFPEYKFRRLGNRIRMYL